MGLELPVELHEPASWAGVAWPQTDENALLAAADAWSAAAVSLRASAGDADRAARSVWAQQQGPAVTAFREWWEREARLAQVLAADAAAADLIAGALTAAAGAVLAAKSAIAAELAALRIAVSTALGTARLTFGASTSRIGELIAASRDRCERARTLADALVDQRVPQLLERAETVLLRGQGAINPADPAGPGPGPPPA